MAAAVPTDEEIIALVLQDINGPDVYSNDKAVFGYLPATKFLKLPHDIRNVLSTAMTRATKPAITLDTMGSTNHVNGYLGDTADGRDYRTARGYRFLTDNLYVSKIALLNFMALRDAGLDAPNAAAVANFRARWITLGCIDPATYFAAGPFTEHDVVANNNAVSAAADRAALATAAGGRYAEWIAECRSTTTGLQWIVSMAEAVWAAAEHCFRVRGHHYKKDYEDLLIRNMTANFEGTFSWPANIAMENVFHTAIHPFGVRALATMAGHFAVLGKLGNGAIIRFAGAPNGAAVVTTARAALMAMATESWYGMFQANYKTQIKKLIAASDFIMNNKFKFHIAARVYGEAKLTEMTVDGERITIADAIGYAVSIASVAQGFINALSSAKEQNLIKTFSLENAKVLQKPAGANPLLSLRVTTLIAKTIEMVQEAKTVKDSSDQVFPAIAAAPATATSPATTTP